MRQLDSSRGYKPLDFGGFGVTGCVTDSGQFLAINSYHPEWGYITLTSAAPFPEDKRYDPPAVRAYRLGLVTATGFGVTFNSPILTREAFLAEDQYPLIRLTLENGITAEVLTRVQAGGIIQQEWRCSTDEHGAHLTGNVWLMRCAYTQLTEGGVLDMPSPVTTFTAKGLENENLPQVVTFSHAEGKPNADGSLSLSGQLPQTATFEITLQFEEQTCSGFPEIQWDGIPDDILLRRGLVYAQQCCIPIEDEAIGILTDHMLLPLSWNRDAYYAIRALANWLPHGLNIMRGHLIWMFQTAERIHGFWGRSYLANGKIKDQGFQLDQQLFPLLELAEYTLESGDESLLKRFSPQLHLVLEHLLERKAPQAWLISTDETPADDPIAYPYALSSHVLMWHTFQTLAQLQFPSPYQFNTLAEQIHASIMDHFVADGKFAYATDGTGKHHFYHDANDLPLAFAPAWGFISADDPIWKATVDFAFSDQNQGGFYDGGLGSVHTPAPWALGDIQRLIIDQALGRPINRHRLQQAAQWDGALPEAYHPQTFNLVSRAWFVWTNAMLGCLERKA